MACSAAQNGRCAWGAQRIGVDGTDGAGKSQLAREVAGLLGIPHLNLDDFLEKNQGGFVDYIKYGELRTRVAAEESFLVEGVCLLQVLSKAELQIDALVYVKRYHLGCWSDERECELEEPLEEFLRRERELLARIAQHPVENFGLGEEIIRYHHQHRPHANAAVVYRRNDG